MPPPSIDVALEFTNPHTGGPVMENPHLLDSNVAAAIKTRAHRQVNSAVYYVHEGQGATIIMALALLAERRFFCRPELVLARASQR